MENKIESEEMILEFETSLLKLQKMIEKKYGRSFFQSELNHVWLRKLTRANDIELEKKLKP